MTKVFFFFFLLLLLLLLLFFFVFCLFFFSYTLSTHLDDLIIFSNTLQEFLEKFNIVLKRLKDCNLKLSPIKKG